jgi:hypothetical protein
MQVCGARLQSNAQKIKRQICWSACNEEKFSDGLKKTPPGFLLKSVGRFSIRW